MFSSSRAYYIDDGVIIKGDLLKRFFYPGYTFYPLDFGCGFSLQYISETDIGNTVFYKKRDAKKKLAKTKHLI